MTSTGFFEIGKKPDMTFAESESYKKLRSNILFSGKDIKIISVTSAVSNEGKSDVSFNLASSLAELGKKTLYIDADMRNSVFLERHRLRHDIVGLAHYLVGEKTLGDITIKTTTQNLSLITFGAYPPNPSELLASDTFKALISLVREQYDYVIIDTPPIAPVVDGLIVSSAADGVVFVIESGKLNCRLVQDTLKQLKQSECRIIGAVLNKVKTGTHPGYDYGYRYGYGYGRSNSKTKSAAKDGGGKQN